MVNFFDVISNTKDVQDFVVNTRTILKDGEGVKSEVDVKKRALGQIEWSDQRRYMTLPRKSSSRINGERSYSFKSTDWNVSNELETTKKNCKSFMNELRVKLTA